VWTKYELDWRLTVGIVPSLELDDSFSEQNKNLNLYLGKLLFKHGDLKKRITFVPLNRTTSNVIPKSKIESARHELGDPNPIYLVKDLINHNHSKYETVMNYVFGSTIIRFKCNGYYT